MAHEGLCLLIGVRIRSLTAITFAEAVSALREARFRRRQTMVRRICHVVRVRRVGSEDRKAMSGLVPGSISATRGGIGRAL